MEAQLLLLTGQLVEKPEGFFFCFSTRPGSGQFGGFGVGVGLWFYYLALVAHWYKWPLLPAYSLGGLDS